MRYARALFLPLTLSFGGSLKRQLTLQPPHQSPHWLHFATQIIGWVFTCADVFVLWCTSVIKKKVSLLKPHLGSVGIPKHVGLNMCQQSVYCGKVGILKMHLGTRVGGGLKFTLMH